MFNSKAKSNKNLTKLHRIPVLNSYLYYTSLGGLRSCQTNFKWLNFMGKNPTGKGMVRAHLIDDFKK